MGERADERQEIKARTVRELIRILERRGYGDLRVAQLEEFAGNRPAVIHWEGSDARFAPDIMARRRGKEYLFQVETAETLQDAGAAEKAVLFSTFAGLFMQQFCLVVPASCRENARKKLLDLQVDERFTRLLAFP